MRGGHGLTIGILRTAENGEGEMLKARNTDLIESRPEAAQMGFICGFGM